MSAAAAGPFRGRAMGIRIAIVGGEAAAVFVLLAVWLSDPSIRVGRSLGVLFFYCFPSEFLVGLVPHEPVLLLYGAAYPALTVALISTAGTVLAEALNYSFLGFFHDIGWFEAMRRRPAVARTIGLFDRAPFLAIVTAGFTPIPFAPIRFLVGMTHYPVGRYLAGVFVSRLPRFVLIAWLGEVVHFRAWTLVAIFALMILALHIPWVGRRGRRTDASVAPAIDGLAVAPVPTAMPPVSGRGGD